MKKKGGLIVLLLIQAVTTSRVFSPTDPVAVCSTRPAGAAVGEAVTLQCHLEPRLDATNMTVEWTQGRFNHTVHLYRDGNDSHAEQKEHFKGRTSLFREALGEGNLSLKLSSVQLSDSGSYRCSFNTDKLYSSCSVDLTVGHNVVTTQTAKGIIIIVIVIVTVIVFVIIAVFFHKGGLDCDGVDVVSCLFFCLEVSSAILDSAWQC